MSLFAPLSDVLAQVRQRESGGNYQAQSPTSTASGAYGFINATWRTEAARAGFSQYADAPAKFAPPAVQDAVAANAASTFNPNSSYLWAASAPPGGYPQPTGNIGVTQDTSSLNLPTMPTGIDYTSPAGAASLSGPFQPADMSAPGGPLDPNATIVQGLGGPFDQAFSPAGVFDQQGSQGGQGATVDALGNPAPAGSWWTAFLNLLGNYVQRGGVALLGLVIIGAGVWALARGKLPAVKVPSK